jgi:hypothetical protein
MPALYSLGDMSCLDFVVLNQLALLQAVVPLTTSPVVAFPGATASFPSAFCFSHCSGV